MSRPLLLALCMLGARFGSAQPIIVTSPSCRSCAIDVRTIVAIGTRDGPGALTGVPRAATIDSRGRIWLLMRQRAPMVFAPNGSFLREVGRVGQGPSEFEVPLKLLPVGDSVVVFDEGGKISVVGPELTVVRSVTSQITRFTSVGALHWPNAIVASSIRQPDQVGYPLHVVNLAGRVAQMSNSFGSDGVMPPEDRELLRRGGISRDMMMERAVSATPDNVFAVNVFGRYEISNWDRMGRLVWQIERRAEFFPRSEIWTIGHPQKKPDPKVVSIWYDSRRYLWIYAHVAAPDWERRFADFRAANPPSPPPPGGSGIRQSSGTNTMPEHGIYHTMIEVIDVQSRSLMTNRLISGFVVGTLPDGRVILYREDADGVPFVDVIAVSLRGGM